MVRRVNAEPEIGLDLGWGVITHQALDVALSQRGRVWAIKCHTCGTTTHFVTSRVNAGTTSCQSGFCLRGRKRRPRAATVFLTALDYIEGAEVRDSVQGWVERLRRWGEQNPVFKVPSESAIRNRLWYRDSGHPKIVTDHDVVYGVRAAASLCQKPPTPKMQRAARKRSAEQVITEWAGNLAVEVKRIFDAIPGAIDPDEIPFRDYEAAGKPIGQWVEEKGLLHALKVFWADVAPKLGVLPVEDEAERNRFMEHFFGEEED